MTTVPSRLTVLCVDDEPRVLEGISLNLRRRFQVLTACGGEAALALMPSAGPIAVIVSDMRMPGMDGTAFLSRARELMPDAVRLLLTGQADLQSAIDVVNNGQIFRFLTKPCPPATLVAAIDAAVEQHRLIVSERELLEQTLHGSIKAMTDILALANPISFGRVLRIKQHASDLAGRLNVGSKWQVEVAAMFSQVGLITLPSATVEKLTTGGTLTDDERAMVERRPAVTDRLLAQIPRLEGVRAILAAVSRPYRQADVEHGDVKQIETFRAAQIVRTAIDYDALEASGHTPSVSIGTLRSRRDPYDPAILDALEAVRVTGRRREEIRELPLSALQVGMVLADDVMLVSGTLLVARGYEITERFVERVRNFAPGTVRQPVRVVIVHEAGAAGAA